MMRKILFSFLFLLSVLLCYTQEYKLSITQKGVFDDREYNGIYLPLNRVIFFSSTIINGSVQKGKHKIVLGYSNVYDFGSPLGDMKHFVNAYYHYNDSTLGELHFGSFNRDEYVADMPLFMQEWAYSYYRPNIQGFGLHIQKPYIDFRAYIDWTGFKDTATNEKFNVGAKLLVPIKDFYGTLIYSMQHVAANGKPNIKQPLRDNLQFAVGGGWKKTFSSKVFTHLSALYFIGLDRQRGDDETTNYDWQTGKGTELSLDVKYVYFGLKASAYFGDAQNVYLGNPFYGSKNETFTGDVPLYHVDSRNYYRVAPYLTYSKAGFDFYFSMIMHFINDEAPLQPLFKVAYNFEVSKGQP